MIKGMAKAEAGKKLPGMAPLQRALGAWVAREHGGNQTSAAKAIGISQSQLSKIIAHGEAAGTRALLKISRVCPREVAAVFGFTVPGARTDGAVLPELERAITVLNGNVSEDAIGYARALAHLWPHDRALGEWVDEIVAYDRALQERSEPGDN
jgi:hypothetical protein